jgi:DNA-binding response OmpR family regulator
MKILVVEDDRTVGQYVKRGLEEQRYHADLVADGMEGLRLASGGRYDLIVLDLRLPEMNGLEVLRTLRDRGNTTPILVLTAQDAVDFKVQALRSGADDYVTKPFSFEELLARVWAQLRSVQRGGDGGVVQAGSLTLDVARRKARLGELVAELSDREFRLLHHLVLHQGEVVSRERLLSEVWGYHFDPRSNVVDVCVRRLRKKLGSDSPIETVRHGGYRLTAA